MSNLSQPEAWLRGPIAGVSALLQPVAHALTQVREDTARACQSLKVDQLCQRLGQAPSIAFHLRHLAGSTDRLFTYARGEALSAQQRQVLEQEAAEPEQLLTADPLLADLAVAIDRALVQLRATPDASLLEPRFVGRQQLPSTVLGLLFHAAEHAARHAGQVVTTARILRAG